MVEEALRIFARYRQQLGDQSTTLSELTDSLQKEIDTVQSRIVHQLAIKRALTDLHYTSLGQHPEAAMNKHEIDRTVFIFIKLKQHYKDTFIQKGKTEGILANLAHDLAKRCGDLLALQQKEKRKYQETDPQELRTYKTALRALLDDAPQSKWGSFLHPEAKSIFNKQDLVSAREMLAYFVMAAYDDNMPLSPELEGTRAQCIEEEKINLIQNLADIRREHNGDPQYHGKHDEIDEPTCPPGVITRLGNMHVHNKLTGREEITIPADHFALKMRAFIINQFSALNFLLQFKIINTIYARILFEEDKRIELHEFYLSLLTEDTLLEFLFALDNEFNGLDEDHLTLATLHYLRELVNFVKKIPLDLLERLAIMANQTLLAQLKNDIEEDLIKENTIQVGANRFSALIKEARSLKEELSVLLKRKESDPINIVESEHELENIKEKYSRILQTQTEIHALIQQTASSKLRAALLPYERKSQKKRGPNYKILSESEYPNIEFSPYWYAKMKLQLEEINIPFLTELVQFSDFLQAQQKNHFQEEVASLNTLLRRLNCSSTPAPSKEASTPLLSPYEIQKTQHFLMTRPEKKYPHRPGALVKIDQVDTDLALLTFIDPFEKEAKNEYRVPIYLLKEYAEKDKLLRQALAHEVDVLLHRFSDLLTLPEPLGNNLRRLFIEQLTHYQKTAPQFFSKALRCQTTLDLHGILENLRQIPKESPFHALKKEIDSALSSWSTAFRSYQGNNSQHQWEQNQVKEAYNALEEEVQKLYFQRTRKKSP